MVETVFPEIYASAYLPKSSGHTEPLEVNEKTGALVIPADVEKVTGFFLEMEVPGHGLNVVVAMKDVGTNGGGYYLRHVQKVEDRNVWRTTRPIEVRTYNHTGECYTPWHQDFSNRFDIFVVGQGGEAHLIQAGIVVRGKKGVEAYYLLIEQLWHGHIVYNQRTGLLVGVPSYRLYGSFESRRPIFDYEPFRRALGRVSIAQRVAEDEEINPPLGQPPAGCWRVDWFVPFAGQRGQGIVWNAAGDARWVTCDQVLDQRDLEELAARKIPTHNFRLIQPDADGVIRFRRGMDVRSLGEMSGRNPKKKGPKYLQGIYLA